MKIEFNEEWFIKIKNWQEHWVDWELFRKESGRGEDFILQGTTKWDGCSDIQTKEGFCIHFCWLGEWKEFGKVLEWVYRTAYGMIAARDEELPKE